MNILDFIIKQRDDVITWVTNNLRNKVSITRKINGKELKDDITLSASDVGASTSNHNHDDSYDTKGAADTALNSAKSYVDEKIGDSSTDLGTHVNDTTKHITSTERTNWNNASTKVSGLATVATSGDYEDLINKPCGVGEEIIFEWNGHTVNLQSATIMDVVYFKVANKPFDKNQIIGSTVTLSVNDQDIVGVLTEDFIVTEDGMDSYRITSSDLCIDVFIITEDESNIIEGFTPGVWHRMDNILNGNLYINYVKQIIIDDGIKRLDAKYLPKTISETVEVTQEEYDALGDVVNTDGKFYCITDGSLGLSSGWSFEKVETLPENASDKESTFYIII